MTIPPNIYFRKNVERIPIVVSILVALLESLVLLGWALDLSFLVNLAPEWSSMKPATGLCFLISCVSLWLLQIPDSIRRYRLGQGLALVVGAAGILTLVRYLSGWEPALDQWLLLGMAGNNTLTIANQAITAPAIAAPAIATWMTPITALNFTFLGCALLLLDYETQGHMRPAQHLAVAVILISLFSVLCYGYGAVSADLLVA